MKTHLKFRSYSKRAKWVLYPTAILVMINFLIYVFTSVYLGGDALNGHIEAGRYFLCAHGHCTEVSRSVWRYSYWYSWATIGSFLLVFAETATLRNTGDIDFE